MEFPEELLHVIAFGYVFPRFLAIDEISYPRRQIAGRYWQQPGRADVLIQHHVSGERFRHPNKVEYQGWM